MTTIDEVVAARNFGRPGALKRGRYPHRPYVPVIYVWREKPPHPGEHQEQVKGFAFATREEALAYAQKAIDWKREHFREALERPYERALREQYGLPREMTQ